MRKRARGETSEERQVCVRGMSMRNSNLLVGALKELYGDAYDDLTLKEVMERHSRLIAQLDGERELNGVAISDGCLEELTLKTELSEAVHGTRGRVVEIDETGSLKLPDGL